MCAGLGGPVEVFFTGLFGEFLLSWGKQFTVRPRKKYCFIPVTARKKNRVGRLGKNIFCTIFFGEKCVFYACFMLQSHGSWEDEKNLR